MVDIADNTKWFQADASNAQAPPNGFPEAQLPSTVNDSARAVMGALKRFYDHVNAVQASAGTANAQTLTYTVAPAAYVTGDVYAFIVGAGLTNTGATTLNINSLGAKNIWIGVNALVGGELREGQMVMVGYDGTQFQLLRGITPAAAGFTPSDPAGTASATAVHMGLGSSCTITPRVSGEIAIHVVGDLGTGTTAGTTITAQIRRGTGAAPGHGVAATGTVAGSIVSLLINGYAANDRYPFSLVGFATGLTVGTAVWIDIALTTSSGTVTVQNLSVIARESSR